MASAVIASRRLRASGGDVVRRILPPHGRTHAENSLKFSYGSGLIRAPRLARPLQRPGLTHARDSRLTRITGLPGAGDPQPGAISRAELCGESDRRAIVCKSAQKELRQTGANTNFFVRFSRPFCVFATRLCANWIKSAHGQPLDGRTRCARRRIHPRTEGERLEGAMVREMARCRQWRVGRTALRQLLAAGGSRGVFGGIVLRECPKMPEDVRFRPKIETFCRGSSKNQEPRSK